MTNYPPFPLQPDIIEILKSRYGLETDEEVCQPGLVREFSDESFAIRNPPKVQKQDLSIEYDSIKVEISVLRPLESSDKVLPVILFLHGGGWCVGGYGTHCGFSNSLVNALSCCVVFVHYSLSPEVRYPIALEECHAALCWMKENSGLININYKSLVVAGDSSGGNLAAALALYEKARGNFYISFQLLLYPAVYDDFKNDSYVENENNTCLSGKMMRYFWSSYIGNYKHKEPTLIPLMSTLEELKNLPPAFIMSIEKDILRSEAEAYAANLVKAGVPTVSVRYFGVDHGFLTEPVLKPSGHLGVSQIIDVLKRHWSFME